MQNVNRVGSQRYLEQAKLEDVQSDEVKRVRSGLAGVFRRSASLLEQLAVEEGGVERLFERLKNIPCRRTRTAAFEALGFEEEIARGLSWRAEKGMPAFDSRDIANILVKFEKGKYGPDMEDCRRVIAARAVELRSWALALDNMSHVGMSVVSGKPDLAEASLDGIGWTLDVANSYGRVPGKLAGPLGALLTGAKMLKNEHDWGMAKLMALTPGMSLSDLARARAGYLSGFGNGLLQAITLGIPLSGILVDIVDTALGESKAPRLPDCSLVDILQAAARDH